MLSSLISAALTLWVGTTPRLCVSKAVETNLHRKAVCISNSWDAELTSSFTDLQGDACCADTLECMSPLPASALCGHILNDHWRLWRECVFVLEYVCSVRVQQCVLVSIFCSGVIGDTCECTAADLHYLSHTHTHTHSRSALFLKGCSVAANKGIRHASSSPWQRSPNGRLTIVPRIWTYHLITLGEGLDCLVKMQVS